MLVRDPQWRQQASSKTFIYPVHVSGLFIEPGTLASALYLLVLRLMNRDYTNAVALIGSIGTDTKMTEEEKQMRAEERQRKNRESAARSHRRKAELAGALEKRAVDAEAKAERLEKEVAKLKAEIAKLKRK